MFKKFFGILIAVTAVVSVSAASLALDASFVEVTNNVGKRDVVVVSGLEPRSVVSIHSESGMLLGRKAANNVSTSVTIGVSLPTITAGKITVSVLERGETIPKTITVNYSAEPTSDVPEKVEITNNVDKRDTIHVDYLEPRDLVSVYSAATGGKKLVSGRVRNGNDEIILSHRQLGKDGGSVWITVTSFGKHESPRVEFKFAAEVASDPISDADVTITNNVNKKGIVEVSNLEPGDQITIFNAEGTRRIGSARCARNRDSIRINTSQLHEDGGDIQMTIKRNNEHPSERFSVNYEGQEKSPSPTSKNNISLEPKRNPTGTNDTLYIDGLEAGDIIRIYVNDTTTSVMLRGTVANNRTDVTLSRAEFAKENEDVTLFVTVTRRNMRESDRVPVKMDAVQASRAFAVKDPSVTITNNAVITSTIFVSGLFEGVSITAYSAEAGGRNLGTSRVAAGASSATINLSLGRENGSVWLTRREPGFAESARVEFTYGEQEQSLFDKLSVNIVNNVGTADTITVSGNIRDGDVVRAYASTTTGAVLGQVTAGSQDYSVVISIGQLGREAGTVFLTITNRGKLESARTPFPFEGEMPSAAISASNITVRNNVNAAPTITVWGLNAGDIVTVYDAAVNGRSLGKGTVDSFASSVTFNLLSLGSEKGSVFVTRKSAGLNESTRTEAKYDEQRPSTPIAAANVTIINNAIIPDIITVTGVMTNDTIKIYSTLGATDPIAEAVVPGGTNTVNISVAQLGTGAGSVFVSVTHFEHSESPRTQVRYTAEQVSVALNDVRVENRTATTVDLIISGLSHGDVIRMYSDPACTILLGSASAVGFGEITITVTINQIGASSGVVYITRTSHGMHESANCAYQYGAWTQS
jgi:hypothetical protein